MIVRGQTCEPSLPDGRTSSSAGPIHLLATWLRQFRRGRWAERRMKMRRGDRDNATKASAANVDLQFWGYRSSMMARITNVQSNLAISTGDLR